MQFGNTYSTVIRVDSAPVPSIVYIQHLYQPPRETRIYGIMVNSSSGSSTTSNDRKGLSEPLLEDHKDLERGSRSSESDHETLLRRLVRKVLAALNAIHDLERQSNESDHETLRRRGGSDKKKDNAISIESYDRARRSNARLFGKVLAAINVMVTLLKCVVLCALFAECPQITISHYLEVGYQSLSDVTEFVLPGPGSQSLGLVVTFVVYGAALLYHDLYHFLGFRLGINFLLLWLKTFRIGATKENDKYIYATHVD